ncbi:EboA domain-containing protein [Micromonospora sp. WMMA1363]|uniref:EboA domain-containing protein n=1 Tax=Micromonospora sp. WMMA1363 TaxID=3053985 RepID=UPI00259CE7F2|nr:EboA domain-containing protein [Micromonospora sp. WMMA1363]MDM4719664.1 EboA domain-containing protein [Micromonospora sp. WMMA1363]
MILDELRAAVSGVPDQGWLCDAVAAVAVNPAGIERRFAEAARRCGRTALPDAPGWNADEAARALLLAALPAARVATCAQDLYWHGDAAEKRAVLKALALLGIGDECVPLLHDAIRSNDPRLVAAALGPCARRLDQAMWRQAVLKCVFMAVPLNQVDGLASRADSELGGMLAGLAEERAAAGRTVPADALDLIASIRTSIH